MTKSQVRKGGYGGVCVRVTAGNGQVEGEAMGMVLCVQLVCTGVSASCSIACVFVMLDPVTLATDPRLSNHSNKDDR